MGARSLGRVGPNGDIAAPMLSDPPPSGKGPSMSTAIILASSVAPPLFAPPAAMAPPATRADDPEDARRRRGLAIADVTRIERKKEGFWTVPSQTGNGKYWVRIREGEEATCTCKD